MVVCHLDDVTRNVVQTMGKIIKKYVQTKPWWKFGVAVQPGSTPTVVQYVGQMTVAIY